MHHVYCDLRLNVDYLMTMRKCSIRCPTRFAGTLKFHKGVKFTPVCVRRDHRSRRFGGTSQLNVGRCDFLSNFYDERSHRLTRSTGNL